MYSKNYFEISENEIRDLDLDFILILDEKINLTDISGEKIIHFDQFIKMACFISPEFSVRFSSLSLEKNKYEGIATGISYVQLSINEENLPKYFVNMANPSQDLFIDFNMFKYALTRLRKNIKYCILGLTIYSFDYDLSKSKIHKNRMLYYFIRGVTKSLHNMDDKLFMEKYLHEMTCNLSKIMIENYIDIVFEKYKYAFVKILEEGRKEVFSVSSFDNLKINNIVAEFNKDYPETRKENINIIENYLRILKKEKIKVLIYIPPISKSYRAIIDENIVMRTREIIESLKRKHEFLILDLYESEEFKNEHYTDGAHLNIFGAKLATEKIANIIKKM